MEGIDSTTGERVSGPLTAKILCRGSATSPAAVFIGGSRVGVAEVEHRNGRHFIGSDKSPALLNNQAHGFCLDDDLELAVRAAL